MKTIKYFILAFSLILISCDKDIMLEVEVPEFEVSVDSAVFKVGDEVTFHFNGDPQFITFYSGEVYNDYQFREERVITIDSTKNFYFESAVNSGTQVNQFALLVSSKFNGNYADSTQLADSVWTDVTTRFVLGTTNMFVASGAKILDEFIEVGKPLYIAFKYTCLPQAFNGLARIWMVQNIKLTTLTDIGEVTLYNTNDIGLRIVDPFAQTAPARSVVTNTRLSMQGNVYDAVNNPNVDPETEHWAITKALNLSGEMNIGRDLPVSVKKFTDAEIKSYTHKFTNPGMYDVTFIAFNQSVSSRKEVIRKVQITITAP